MSANQTGQSPDRRNRWRRLALIPAGAALIGVGIATLAPRSAAPLLGSPAIGQAPATTRLPDPPANGIMGFVIDQFVQPVFQDKGACPEGTVLKLRDAYLQTLPADERARLSRKENETELVRLWHGYAFGPRNTNICSQPDMFSRPAMRTVLSQTSWGLNLDGKDGGGDSAATCAHDNFTDPHGQAGIDNQEYRVMGCTLEWRGVDGTNGDQQVGMRQFITSGEWTQVILLRGVKSLVHDDNVEVVLANTPDRPPVDSKGRFLPGASFSVSDKAPRNRNVLHGRIENGVLTTEPADILLAQTWGQGGARDIRGNRTKWDFRSGRLRLTFQPDGSLHGLLGGYRPVFDVIQSAAIGGAGSATVAGIDCAQQLQTLRRYADGIRDPRTGQCGGVSSAVEIGAIPAFVNDISGAKKPGSQGIAAR